MSVKVLQVVVPLGLSLCIGSCIVVPVPQLPGEPETKIASDQIEQIEAGETRRADVLRELGPPDYSFGNDTRWVYAASSRRAGGVRWCGGAAVPLPNGDGELDNDDFLAGGGCTARREDQAVTYLDIGFSATGEVAVSRLVGEGDARCGHSGICFDSHHNVMAFGSEQDDAAAKSGPVRPGGCALFLYSTDDGRAAYFRIDDTGDTHRLHTEDGFLRFDLDAGQHRVDVALVNRLEQNAGSIRIDCTDGSSRFIRHQRGRRNAPDFLEVPAAEGRQQVLKRKLLLTRDPGGVL